MTITRLYPEKRTVRIGLNELINQNMARAERGQSTLHQCSVCGECGEWSETWSWYGSYREADEGMVAKFCSAACREKESGESVLRRMRRGA